MHPAPAPAEGAASDEPLQFDRAEFKDAPAGRRCASCHQPITQEYFAAGAAVLCPNCATRFSGIAAGKSAFLKAAALGFGAAVLGTVIWSLMIKVTGSELGIVAIAVGLLVGMAVRRGSGGRGGWKYQTLAMALTYVSITASYVPFVLEGLSRHSAPPASETKPGAPAPGSLGAPTAGAPPGAATLGDSSAATAARPAPAVAAPSMPVPLAIALFVVLVFGLAFAAPFLAGASNIIGLLIIGIALYEAWKLNRRIPITGPFRIAADSPPPPVAP